MQKIFIIWRNDPGNCRFAEVEVNPRKVCAFINKENCFQPVAREIMDAFCDSLVDIKPNAKGDIHLKSPNWDKDNLSVTVTFR